MTKQRMEAIIRAYGLSPVYPTRPMRLGRDALHLPEMPTRVGVERLDVRSSLGRLADVLAMTEEELQKKLATLSNTMASTIIREIQTASGMQGWSPDDGGTVA